MTLVSPSNILLLCLQDVISLRKRSGTIQGEVRLNGWLQDPVSFRRCSGYVEQFDVQSPELTVRETVLFSARLRLDPLIVDTDEKKQAFVDHILEEVELTSLASDLVGTDESGGLSFEQKKRLSIAVELAASPSLLFLDEVRYSSSYIVEFWSGVCSSYPKFCSCICSLLADWTLVVQSWLSKHFGR
jgi:ABC-type phosphate transport system ATPase subunit